MSMHRSSLYQCETVAKLQLWLIICVLVFYLPIGHSLSWPLPAFRVSGQVSDVTPVGSEAAILDATDRDTGRDGELTFAITAGNTPLFFKIVKISATEGEIEIDHTPISPGDHVLTVVVYDGGTPPKTATATATITVIASSVVNCSDPGLG